MLSKFCSYIESIYGGRHWIETGFLGLKILYIENGEDRFRIHLADKIRFGKYDLYHRNSGKRLDGTWPYHKQSDGYDLAYVIYNAYIHDFNKKYGIWVKQGDYKRFMSDYKKFLAIT